MTESEAIKVLKEKYRTMSMCLDIEDCKRNKQAISKAISALEEIQKYRALGTVEELQEAMEKQRAKKPAVNKYYYFCSNCGARRSIRQKHKFCHNCGQAIDWSEEE